MRSSLTRFPIHAALKLLALFIAGAIISFSFAPYNVWPAGIAGAVVLALSLKGRTGRQAIWLSFVFGLGLYGAGVYWVYGAIHDFGYTSAPLALIMTGLFVSFLALVFALPFYLYGRFLSATWPGYLLGFAAVWVLGEWMRTWFLTGFPWLFLGYAHIDTWLAGWAPVFGVLGVSYIAIFCGVALAELISEVIRWVNPKRRGHPLKVFALALSLLCPWLSGHALYGASWGTQTEQTISAAVVQPNIPLEIKWNPMYLGFTMDVLREHTAPHWGKDLIVWPEAAVPMMYHDAGEFFDELESKAKENNSALITGVLYDDEKPRTYYNAITGFGNASGLYFKKRLVPFGEYVPLEQWLRGLINFFDLPNSIIQPGPWEQDILQFKNYKISPSICYEIVYPELVSEMARDADLLITISNDAWFGDSIGPKQHFQMAQMRALENHRFVIRSTNTGISGFIGPQGQVKAIGNQFNRESLAGEVTLYSGLTPYMRWGDTPLLAFIVIIVLLSVLPRFNRAQRSTEKSQD